jgi:hypothetical protein
MAGTWKFAPVEPAPVLGMDLLFADSAGIFSRAPGLDLQVGN